MTDTTDTLASAVSSDSVVKISLVSWYEGLNTFWKALIPSVVAGLLLLVLGWLYKWLHEMRACDPKNSGALTSYSDFYGEDIDIRYAYKFVEERAVEVEKNGKTEIILSKPLELVLNWIKTGGKLLVIYGTGGMGKSRLLLEAAKKRNKLRFVRTRQAESDFEKLARQVREHAKKGSVLVFDDCQEYAGDFAQLLDAAWNAGTRVIASTRYLSSIETALQKAHVTPEELRLEPMVNASQVVPVEDKEVQKSIARIAQRNPANAVMAWMQYERTGSLKGIQDAFNLTNSVFNGLIEVGMKYQFPDTRDFLAEMAIRGGLWQDHQPYPGHEKLVAQLRRMGHIWEGGTSERRVYGVMPDQLRDHIIREVYAAGDVLQPGLACVVKSMPDEETIHVVRILGIQYRETGKDVWKQAVAQVMDKLGIWSNDSVTGIKTEITNRQHELVIDVGYNIWRQFGDIALVRKHLGDFCIGAEMLDSIYHLNRAGLFCENTGEVDRALAYYRAGLKLSEKQDKKADQAMFLCNIGNIWKYKGNLDKALEYLEISLVLDRELGSEKGEAESLANIGLIYKTRGNLDEALEYQEKALVMMRKQGMKLKEAQILGNIGNIWCIKKDLDKALEYQLKALEIGEEIGDKGGVAIRIGNIGNILMEKGDLNKALEYQEKALAMMRKQGMKLKEAENLSNIGNILIEKGDLDKALEYLNRSLEICTEGDYRETMAATLLNIGSIFISIKDWEKAVTFYVPSLMEHLAMGISDGPQQCLNALGKCLEALGKEKFLKSLVKNGMEQERIEWIVEMLEHLAFPPETISPPEAR